MKTYGKEDDAWNVQIMLANGAVPINVMRVPRDVAEKIVIGFLFDTDNGIGMGGYMQPADFARIGVWTTPWQ